MSGDSNISLITIHGTGDSALYSSNQKWWEEGSRFLKQLKSHIVPKCLNIKPFIWSGENSQRARERAAIDLAAMIKSYDTDLHIIAHSHGGHVCLRALSELNDNDHKRISIHMIGTPHITQSWSARMMLNVLIGLIGMMFLFFYAWALISARIFSNNMIELASVLALICLSFFIAKIVIYFGISWAFHFVLMASAIIFIYLVDEGIAVNLLIGIFSMATFSFIHFGKVATRIRYDSRIYRACKREKVTIKEIYHPEDEVFDLFLNRKKINLKIASKNIVRSLIRTIAVYAHFVFYCMFFFCICLTILNIIQKKSSL